MTTRDVILDAAAEVMRAQGLARSTTREIARAAGYSEATLYKHFADKTELVVAVLHERSPGFAQFWRAVSVHDTDDLVDGLTSVTAAAIAFYQHSFPLLGSVFSDPAILDAHRAGLRRLGAGPHKANEAVIAYLRDEQAKGRVRTDADLYAAASLLLGAALQHALLSQMGWDGRRSDEEAARGVATLLAGPLSP